jgi:hypothetical protein
VKLSGPDGTYVILLPAAYEFPDDSSAVLEFDWLVIEVNATTADGAWSSRDACLTTGDGPSIGEWLRSVTAGSIPVTLRDADGDITPDLTFLEPALAFSLAPSDDDLKHVRVHLTYGLAPPWLDVDERINMWKFFVEVAMTEAQILAAARSWETDLIAFPQR